MDVLQHLGIDLGAVPEDFKGAVAGRTLIMDGDGPAYRVAAKCKRLDTAIRQYHTVMLTEMFMTEAQFLTVHLTANTSQKNGRGNIIATQPYQGNRKNKSKPPLLEPLRTALTLPENWLPEMNVILHHELEADDGMMIQSYQLKEDGVIWSDDKDLRLTPYPYYEQSLGVVTGSVEVGSLWKAYTPAGAMKILGRADKFFWCQMLMGDTADNVKGIDRLYGKLCGKAAAYNLLKDCKSVSEAANLVFDAYRFSDQNVLAEGWMLHLLRFEGDNFWHYAMECGLSPENQAFLTACAKRHWRLRPNERRDYDKGKWTSDIYVVA